MTAATTRTAAQILRVLPRERITRLLGHLGAARLPQPVLRPFLSAYQRAYRVDMHEAVVPDGGFQSFNEFFTRRVHDGVHRVDPREDVVVSPADGRLDDLGPIDDARRFVVKGNDYNAAELLGDEAEAADFAGGHFAVVYLSPRDYHRVHSPVAGRVRRVRHLPGTLYPVNDIGVRHVPRLLSRNERVVVRIESEGLGPVALVFVGAFVVGGIDLAFPGPARPAHGGATAERDYGDDGPRLARGDEVGLFRVGSTAVVLVPPQSGAVWAAADGRAAGPVRMGDAMLQRTSA
jgi:phosphatidylserine decarboxylase